MGEQGGQLPIKVNLISNRKGRLCPFKKII